MPLKIFYYPFDFGLCKIVGKIKKTADKQKDVRYNGCRTKSNAALSMGEEILMGSSGNSK